MTGPVEKKQGNLEIIRGILIFKRRNFNSIEYQRRKLILKVDYTGLVVQLGYGDVEKNSDSICLLS